LQTFITYVDSFTPHVYTCSSGCGAKSCILSVSVWTCFVAVRIVMDQSSCYYH